MGKARYSMVSHDHPWTFQKEWTNENITNSYQEMVLETRPTYKPNFLEMCFKVEFAT